MVLRRPGQSEPEVSGSGAMGASTALHRSGASIASGKAIVPPIDKPTACVGAAPRWSRSERTPAENEEISAAPAGCVCSREYPRTRQSASSTLLDKFSCRGEEPRKWGRAPTSAAD